MKHLTCSHCGHTKIHKATSVCPKCNKELEEYKEIQKRKEEVKAKKEERRKKKEKKFKCRGCKTLLSVRDYAPRRVRTGSVGGHTYWVKGTSSTTPTVDTYETRHTQCPNCGHPKPYPVFLSRVIFVLDITVLTALLYILGWPLGFYYFLHYVLFRVIIKITCKALELIFGKVINFVFGKLSGLIKVISVIMIVYLGLYADLRLVSKDLEIYFENKAEGVNHRHHTHLNDILENIGHSQNYPARVDAKNKVIEAFFYVPRKCECYIWTKLEKYYSEK